MTFTNISSEAGRSDMERAAEAAGSRLKDEVDFRGVFTVDGIMSEQGFVATELNPRFGAGIRYAFECLPDLPLELVHRAAVAGDADRASTPATSSTSSWMHASRSVSEQAAPRFGTRGTPPP